MQLFFVNRLTAAGFVAALAALIATGVVSLQIPAKQSESKRWVDHTHEVIQELEGISSNVKDAETGQRGYLITGDERYLEPYEAAIAQIDAQLQQLKTLTVDNPTQQRWYELLERQIDARLGLIEKTIALRQTKGFQPAVQVVLSGEGKRRMDSIRQVIAQMKQEENRLLARRTQDYAANAQTTKQILLLLLGGNLALVCLVFYLVNRDLGKRQQVERELRESEQRLMNAILEAPFPAMIHAEDGEVIQINQSWQELTGYQHAEIPTIADWTQKAYGERKEFVKADREKLYGLNSRLAEGEYVVTTNTGEARTWDFSSAPLGKLPDGRRTVLSMAVDVTARSQTEAALRDSEIKFKRIVESNMVGIVFWNTSGGITEANNAFLRIVGYTQEDIQLGNVRWQDMTPPEYQHLDRKALAEVAANGVCTPFEKEYIRKDGSRISVMLGAAILDGCQDRGVGFVLDITETKQLEARLRQQAEELTAANRMKDEFLAVVSHEIRNPLNSILGWAELLLNRKLDEKTVVRATETIHRSAKMQAQMIEDLLDISRIARGKIQLNVDPVDLVSLISAAVDRARPAAQKKQIEILELNSLESLTVCGDSNRLQQVFGNLISNAIKFTPQGGQIAIELESRDSSVCIRVSDTGCGISAEFLPYIFDRFRQGGDKHARSHGGLGLGLAIVRQLVELHGGTIQAESLGTGQGATFTVNLPLIAANESAKIGDETEREAPSLQGLHVLAVDDQVDTLELLKAILEDYGARVTTVASSAEALDAIARSRFDILLSDISMPQEDGYTLIRKVRTLEAEQGSQQIPAAAITANAREEDRTQALSAGFQLHLPKPINPEELVAVVARLSGRSLQSNT